MAIERRRHLGTQAGKLELIATGECSEERHRIERKLCRAELMEALAYNGREERNWSEKEEVVRTVERSFQGKCQAQIGNRW
jgi:hypothetical protein